MPQKDNFGANIGTLAYKVNACVTKTTKTEKKIQEEVGTTTGISRYLAQMVGKGHFVKTTKGYKLAPKKK